MNISNTRKICIKCGSDKTATRKNGHKKWVRNMCHNCYNKNLYHSNVEYREYMLNVTKIWNLEHREHVLNRHRMWNQEHKEYFSNYKKIWYTEHPDYYIVRNLEHHK